jgi:hypothetical protein
MQVGVIPGYHLGRDGGSKDLSDTLLCEMSDLGSRIHVEFEKVIPGSLEERRRIKKADRSQEEDCREDLNKRSECRGM